MTIQQTKNNYENIVDLNSAGLSQDELTFINTTYNNRNTQSPFRSAVKFYKDGKLDKSDTTNKFGICSNTTVGYGREFINQRVFGGITGFNSSGDRDLTNHKVSHFGIGSGGSVVDGGSNIVTLNGPTVCDTDLYDPQEIHPTAITSPVTGQAKANTCKLITSSSSGTAFGSLTAEISVHNEFTSGTSPCPGIYYTITKALCVIESVTEPSVLPTANDFLKFDEMALYATYFNGTNYIDPILFAHICFPPKWIQLAGQNAFEWYVIF